MFDASKYYDRKKTPPDADQRLLDQLMAERPRDTFKDLKDELTRAFHESAVSRTYSERVANLKRFVTLGVELLPKEEEDYRKTTRKFIREEIQVPQIKLTPKLDSDKQPIYQLNTNLSRGAVSKCHIQDLPFVYKELVEAKNEEIYNQLAPVAAELVAKLKDYHIIEFERTYYEGGKLSEKGDREPRRRRRRRPED